MGRREVKPSEVLLAEGADGDPETGDGWSPEIGLEHDGNGMGVFVAEEHEAYVERLEPADFERVRRNARLGRLLVERAQTGYVGFTVGETNGSGWVASCEFGREAEDSPMVGGANYGTGSSADEAIDSLLDEARVA